MSKRLRRITESRLNVDNIEDLETQLDTYTESEFRNECINTLGILLYKHSSILIPLVIDKFPDIFRTVDTCESFSAKYYIMSYQFYTYKTKDLPSWSFSPSEYIDSCKINGFDYDLLSKTDDGKPNMLFTSMIDILFTLCIKRRYDEAVTLLQYLIATKLNISYIYITHDTAFEIMAVSYKHEPRILKLFMQLMVIKPKIFARMNENTYFWWSAFKFIGDDKYMYALEPPMFDVSKHNELPIIIDKETLTCFLCELFILYKFRDEWIGSPFTWWSGGWDHGPPELFQAHLFGNNHNPTMFSDKSTDDLYRHVISNAITINYDTDSFSKDILIPPSNNVFEWVGEMIDSGPLSPLIIKKLILHTVYEGEYSNDESRNQLLRRLYNKYPNAVDFKYYSHIEGFDPFGERPMNLLTYISINNHRPNKDLHKLLIDEYGFDYNTNTNYKGRNSLMAYIALTNGRNVGGRYIYHRIGSFIYNGSDIEFIDDDGNNALLLILSNIDIYYNIYYSKVEPLINNNTITAVNNEGKTVIDIITETVEKYKIYCDDDRKERGKSNSMFKQRYIDEFMHEFMTAYNEALFSTF